LLIVFLITFLVAAAVGRSWFHRRLRRPELLRQISLVVGGMLLVTNLASFLLEAPQFWRTANFTATVGGLAALGVVMTALRTGGVPARQPRRVLAIGSRRP
jgi:ABC-type Fe3+ transport system permease subunit